MARHRRTSLYEWGMADIDECIQKKSHIILRSCLVALCLDPTTLTEIAVCVSTSSEIWSVISWSFTEYAEYANLSSSKKLHPLESLPFFQGKCNNLDKKNQQLQRNSMKPDS